MNGDVYFLQNSAAHNKIIVKSSYLQIIDPIPDYLAAQVLYVQVPVLTGTVQTDKQHAHDCTQERSCLRINVISNCYLQ